MTKIERFAQSEGMTSKPIRLSEKKKMTVLPQDVRRIEILLAGVLLHCNTQCPCAIANATLPEDHATTSFTEGRNTYYYTCMSFVWNTTKMQQLVEQR